MPFFRPIVQTAPSFFIQYSCSTPCGYLEARRAQRLGPDLLRYRGAVGPFRVDDGEGEAGGDAQFHDFEDDRRAEQAFIARPQRIHDRGAHRASPRPA